MQKTCCVHNFGNLKKFTFVHEKASTVTSRCRVHSIFLFYILEESKYGIIVHYIAIK